MAILQNFLSQHLEERGWNIRDFHDAVVLAGAPVTFHAVYRWVRGSGGIADRHKPAVARALGVSLGELTAASVDELWPEISAASVL